MSERLPPWLEAAVQRETAGEAIRWTGRPGAFRSFAWSSLIWLFAVPWTAFALFWEAGVVGGLLLGKGAQPLGSVGHTWGWVMGLFGLPFILVGLGMMLLPFGVLRSARRTVHVLTSKRLLTITEGRIKRVKSVFPDQIRSIERTERPDGSGNLRLILGYEKDSDGDTVTKTQDLFAIPDVRRVEGLLMELKRRAA